VKIAIIDPGLIQSGGHHFEINRFLCAHLSEYGYDCSLFAHLDFRAPTGSDNPLKVTSLFRLQPYIVSASPYHRLNDHQRFTLYEIGRIEVLNLLVKLADKYERFIIPTAFHYMLQAVADFRALGFLNPVDAVFHTFPNEAQSGSSEVNRPLLKASIEALTEVPRNVRIHTFETEIQLSIEQFIRKGFLCVEKAPIPHNGAIRTKENKFISTITIAGHVGRKEKGIQYLSQISRLAEQLNLTLVIQDSTPNSVVKSLDLAKGTKFFGYVDDFPNFIADQDLVVLPYERDFYRYSGSGVAWEAIASGIPLLCPIGTNPSITSREYGCGSFFTSGDFESFSTALRLVVENYALFVDRSFTASRLFNDKNGTAAFSRHITRPHVSFT
jgi:glycosyltransferase involved in cell wall biosynthesis